MRRDHHTRPAIDIPLLTVLFILCACSLVMLSSNSEASTYLLLRKSGHIALAFVLLWIFAHISPPTLTRWIPVVYLLSLLLLSFVLVAGSSSKGAQRWLDLGLFRFQPAEIMKIAVPAMVIWIQINTPLLSRTWRMALSLLAILAPAALVLIQPDLGTAILLVISGLVIFYFAGVSWKPISAAVIVVGIAVPFLWNLALQDYQRRRIVTLFDPWADPLGSGYHTIQSIIAVGSGGLQGKGWLAGSQSRLDFVPELNTDFIFAIYAEEFGFFGALLLLLLYLFLGCRGLLISFSARDNFSRLLAACLSITFFFQVFVNIGMVVGILPVVGVTLPLLSYGGTSLVIVMVSFGILMSIHRHQNTSSLK